MAQFYLAGTNNKLSQLIVYSPTQSGHAEWLAKVLAYLSLGRGKLVFSWGPCLTAAHFDPSQGREKNRITDQSSFLRHINSVKCFLKIHHPSARVSNGSISYKTTSFWQGVISFDISTPDSSPLNGAD
ncbi:hypothetical protein J6590_077781 [Homalodisca vitripennis]|nr:hypothetical protein J6590_077781 [Homalodisca vitripennis]